MRMTTRCGAALTASLLAAFTVMGPLGVSARGDAALPLPAEQAPPARAINPNLPPFVEIPGEMEFTGNMLLRPVQPDAYTKLGATQAEAIALYDQAVDRIRHLIISHAPGPDRYLLRLPAGTDESTFAASLLATGQYDFVHPDWLLFPIATTPNDPLYNQQWQHPRMQSPQAWDITTGNASMIVAIVDSGVDLSHADLQASLVSGYNSVDGIPQANGGQVNDLNGHGTACAGCAGAIGNNSVGMAGMSWNTRIMPVRCSNLSSGNANMSHILGGAEWAVQNGANISSCSYSGVTAAAVGSSGTYIKSIGGLLVYAAGNSNTNLAGFDWLDTIVVGATDQNDNKASFSSYGQAVDLFAPGVDVGTTFNGGGYGGASGTSFSTPIVAGLLSLIWGINPDLPPSEVENLLFLSCDDLGAAGNDDYWGWGRANAYKAAQLVAGTLVPQPPIANPDYTFTLTNQSVGIEILKNDFDANLDSFSLNTINSPSANGGTIIINNPLFGGFGDVRYTPPSGFNGFDTFTYTIIDETGMVSEPGTVTVEVIPLSAFKASDPVANPMPGIPVSYYSIGSQSQMPNFDNFEPISSQILAFINAPSTDGEFMGSGLSDYVGAVFEGFVQVPALGEYTFYTESDDGSLLYIGDQLVVNNDGLHGMVEQSGTIRLRAGTHRIRVEFFENGGGAGLFVRWAGANLPKATIPGSAWLHDAAQPEEPCPGDLNGDDLIDADDLGVLLGAFGTNNADADLNADGLVDADDLGLLLSAFGQTCH